MYKMGPYSNIGRLSGLRSGYFTMQGRALNVSRAVGQEEQVELAGAFEPVPFPPMAGTCPDTSWSGNYFSALLAFCFYLSLSPES